MFKQKTDRAIIGLDIGSDSIQAIKGTKSEGKITVLDFACKEYSLNEDTVGATAQSIYELLTSIEDAKKIRKTEIHSIISGRKLCIRVVKLPVIPEAELYQAIKSKIRKYVSVDIDQVIFSFSILGQTQEKDVNKLEVAFMAIQRESLNEYLQLFEASGVQPKIVTSTCFSGWNLVREFGLGEETASLMLINIADQETDLSMYRDGRFIFTRNISIGGRDFTDGLKGQSQFFLENPQDINLLWGFRDQQFPPEVQDKDKAAVMRIREFLQNEGNILCKEIDLTANHFYQITHGEKIDKCIVFGKASGIGGLVEFLKQKLEIPVEALRIPDAKLGLSPEKREVFKKNLPLYSQALGALLSSSDDVNLVAKVHPQAKRARPFIKSLALSKIPTILIFIFVTLALLGFAFLKGFSSYYQYQIKAYRAKQDELRNRAMQSVGIKRRIDTLDFERALYFNLLKRYPSYPVIIAEICKAIPSQNVVFDELSFVAPGKKGGVSQIRFAIKGGVLTQAATASETTNFVLALERSGHFENISVSITSGVARRYTGSDDIELEGARKSNFNISGNVKLK